MCQKQQKLIAYVALSPHCSIITDSFSPYIFLLVVPCLEAQAMWVKGGLVSSLAAVMLPGPLLNAESSKWPPSCFGSKVLNPVGWLPCLILLGRKLLQCCFLFPEIFQQRSSLVWEIYF